MCEHTVVAKLLMCIVSIYMPYLNRYWVFHKRFCLPAPDSRIISVLDIVFPTLSPWTPSLNCRFFAEISSLQTILEFSYPQTFPIKTVQTQRLLLQPPEGLRITTAPLDVQSSSEPEGCSSAAVATWSNWHKSSNSAPPALCVMCYFSLIWEKEER